MDKQIAIRFLFLLSISRNVISQPASLGDDYCTSLSDGLYPHPHTCSQFVICTYGRVIVQSCGEGMQFDPQINACKFGVGCSQSQEQPSNHVTDRRNSHVNDGHNSYSDDRYFNYGGYGNTDNGYRYRYDGDRMDVVHEPHYYDTYRPPSNQYDQYGPHGIDPRRRRGDARADYYDSSAHVGSQTRQSYSASSSYETHQSFDTSSSFETRNSRPHSEEYAAQPHASKRPFVDDSHVNDPRDRHVNHRNPTSEGRNIQYERGQDYVHIDTNDPYIFKEISGQGSRGVEVPSSYPAESSCAQGDGLYAHPDNCTRYIQCANGRTHEQQCPSGTYFSRVNQICSVYDGECHLTGGRKDTSGSSSPFDDQHMGEIREFLRSSLIEAKVQSIAKLSLEVKAARKLTVVRRPFGRVASFLGSTPYVHQLSMPAFLQLECLRMIKERFKLSKADMEEVVNVMDSALPINPYKVSPDMEYPIPTMSACPYPKNDENNNCDPDAPFRTMDGSCNNLKRPLWGKSFRALTRFLYPDYCDGVGQMRCASDGGTLPSTRAVSVAIFGPDESQSSPVHTLMHMTFGQFLAHDNERTAVTKLSKNEDGAGELVDVMCGDDGCSTTGPENRACEPIPIGRRDPDFMNKTCLMFVRTQEVMRDDCRLAPRDQLNQLTSWFDASVIYGSTKNESDKLRDLTKPDRGLLRLIDHPYDRRTKKLLPNMENKDCRDLNETIQCFTAGDGRVNEQIGLITMHTMFAREHNRMENELHHLNPHWSGERLFHETQKIMAAIWQVIVYEEYLPLVIGPGHMRQFGLELVKTGYWYGYDDSVNGDIANSFATAAFRFGHSQISDVIRLIGRTFSRRNSRDLDFSTVLNRPLTIYETDQPAGSAIDSIMLGMASQAAEKVDTHFSKEVSVRLFSENPPREPGLDLPAINIQRGRDHGLPAYNKWRSWCGLPAAKDFQDLIDVPEKIRLHFSRLYQPSNHCVTISVKEAVPYNAMFFTKVKNLSEGSFQIPLLATAHTSTHPLAEMYLDLFSYEIGLRQGEVMSPSHFFLSVDDVDLYAAGVVEKHVPGGMVGPTFACIIAHQFRNLRVADRFWHETPDRNIGFTPGQLKEVRKASLARVMCDNGDRIDTIQPFVMLQPIKEALGNLGSRNLGDVYNLASHYRGDHNERRPCSQVPRVNLELWRETRY